MSKKIVNFILFINIFILLVLAFVFAMKSICPNYMKDECIEHPAIMANVRNDSQE